MQWVFCKAPSPRWLGLGLFAFCFACSAEYGEEEANVAVQSEALSAADAERVIEAMANARIDSGSFFDAILSKLGGGRGVGGCKMVDDADTTCNGKDDDCDGEVDEDCTFGPKDCPPGYRVIEGDHRSNFLWGTSGNDCVLGYGGDDVLWGFSGKDVLVGGPGDDAIAGWDGDDVLFGDEGDDILLGNDGNDVLDGGEGNDYLYGGSGNDDVRGGACHDHLIASGGKDILLGDEGADRIFGRRPHHIDGGSGTDACSGESCELSESVRECRRDTDCRAHERCVKPVGLCVPKDEAPVVDATCDGYDDDCDGRIDEDYVPGYSSCGMGVCAATGVTKCVRGVEQNSCVPGTPSGDDTSCNGVDDDCDGASDEGFAAAPTSCGVGACASTGAVICAAGMVIDTCTPGTPAPSDASCDAIDDDCDGSADEHYASGDTSCGAGACASTGATMCTGGAVTDSCVPGTPAANDASCDAVDDDCDGAVDEDHVAIATSCGVGACAATGTTFCAGGVEGDTCSPLPPAPDDASCDGIDDDCDGVSDEDYVPVPTSCEASGCSATGTTSCVNGELQDDCADQPSCIAEIDCDDSADNDGDGLSDCDDPDCDSAHVCRTQPFTASVSGSANIWGANFFPPPGGGARPPALTLPYGAGSIVRVISVTGTVTPSSGLSIGGDGVSGAWSVPDSTNIAGYSHDTLGRSMVGVFLGDAAPAPPPPARLHFTDGDFTELAPAIGQIFFIGDGRTSLGEPHRFIVPEGATRLFLGTTDICSTGGIGCWGDNAGAWQVAGEFEMAP